jgi:hypothetical protein
MPGAEIAERTCPTRIRYKSAIDGALVRVEAATLPRPTSRRSDDRARVPGSASSRGSMSAPGARRHKTPSPLGPASLPRAAYLATCPLRPPPTPRLRSRTRSRARVYPVACSKRHRKQRLRPSGTCNHRDGSWHPGQHAGRIARLVFYPGDSTAGMQRASSRNSKPTTRARRARLRRLRVQSCPRRRRTARVAEANGFTVFRGSRRPRLSVARQFHCTLRFPAPDPPHRLPR